jgi:flagellar FliJ protein
MARFRFQLEPLLRARRATERIHQMAVAELDQRRVELERTLRRQQQFISTGKREMTQRLVGPLEMSSLRQHAGSTIGLMRQGHRIVLELAGLHKRLEAARAGLREAARERRVVERLRERRFEQWRMQMQKAEDAAIDELAVQSAARPRSSFTVDVPSKEPS